MVNSDLLIYDEVDLTTGHITIMARHSKSTAKMKDNEKLLLKSKINVFDEVKRYLNVSRVKRAISLGSGIANVVAGFLEKPTWWNATKSVFGVVGTLIEDVEIWGHEYFESDDWAQPYSTDFNQTLVNVLQHFPFERIKTSNENQYVRICTLSNGCKVGWTYSSRIQSVDRIYVETARFEEAKAEIKKLLWEQFSHNSLVMRKSIRTHLTDESTVIFEVDDAFDTKLSERATTLSRQLKVPIENGVNRSIMLYGPPGTGKSTVARTVIEIMGLRSFRIRIGDLGGLDNGTLFEAINIFEPDAIILDDFDRALSQESLLETLEFFQQRIKLIITTVNNLERLDKALLRPGRIDIIELVDKMDTEVVKYVLGEFNDGFELVKNWPIAYINEYVKRRRFMSTEDAVASIKELTLRVNDVTHYDDDAHNDVNTMLNQIDAPDTETDLSKYTDDDADDDVKVETVTQQHIRY